MKEVPDTELYRRMRVIRRFEDRVVELVTANEIPGVTHEYSGQEAVAVGVCSNLRADDVVTSTHRGHGHMLAKGAEPAAMFAELMGLETGVNRGRGGSMHIADFSLGILGANGIVGAGVPIACGAAYAFMSHGSDAVGVSFFGEGGINQGVVLESLNLAAIWDLPVVFVCENNQYAVSTPVTSVSRTEIFRRAEAFGMPAEAVDGMDVRIVRAAAERAVARARDGKGPSFLECETYRFSGHYTVERLLKLNYRTDDEIELWRQRDPLERLATALSDGGGWGDASEAQIRQEVEDYLDEALRIAREGAVPDPASALAYMYAHGYDETPSWGWE